MPGEPSEDLYSVLGVDAGIDSGKLRQVWRKLARRWHPDHAGPRATPMFQRLSAAYEVLVDPVARAAYDRRRSPSAAVPTSVGARRRAPPVMISRVCGPLNSLLACGIARRANSGVIDLHLNAQEAAQGGMVTISMRVPVRKGQGVTEELFSAWLAIYPGVADGAIIAPSVLLPGMVQPVHFCVRLHATTNRPNQPPEPTV